MINHQTKTNIFVTSGLRASLWSSWIKKKFHIFNVILGCVDNIAGLLLINHIYKTHSLWIWKWSQAVIILLSCACRDNTLVLFVFKRAQVTVERFGKLSLNFSVSLFIFQLVISTFISSVSFMIYYYLLICFSIFGKYYFQISFNLTVTVILSMVKITQNTMTVLL